MSTLRQALEHIKTAATRQVKEVRKLVAAGRMDEARALAAKLEAGNVLKKSKLGTPVKRLGKGREGIADLVLGAADAPTGHELAVRKTYDPKASMFNPELPTRKVQIGQALGEDPNFARMFTRDQAHMAGNVPYHIAEFVPGKGIGSAPITQQVMVGRGLPDIVRRGNAAAAGVLGHGAQLEDILTPRGPHSDNTRLTQGGTPKIIDYMPFKATEQGELRDIFRDPLVAINRKYPNFTQRDLEKEQEMVGHFMANNPQKGQELAAQLNAQEANVVEGFKQLGGSRQERKVRGAKPAPSAAVPPPRPVPSAAAKVPGPNLMPTMAPSLRARFHDMPLHGKAAILGGAATGLGLGGLGAYRAIKAIRERRAQMGEQS